MTTSIKELRKELLEDVLPLSTLLRKAILIARTLKDAEAEKWISSELNGYQIGEEAPDYRIVHGRPVFLNPYRGWQVLLIEGDNREIARLVTSMPTFSPLGEVESHAKQTELKLQYGREFEQLIQSRTNLQGTPALLVSGTQFQNVLTAVRNKLFDWVSGLPDESESVPIPETPGVPMPSEKTWRDTVDRHPLRFALVTILTTAGVVAGVMGYVQKVQTDNLTTKCETEKAGMKNEYEAQIRALKAQIEELQKRVPPPAGSK